MDREIAGLAFDNWPEAIGLLTFGVALVGWLMKREGLIMVSRGANIVTLELAEDATEAKAIISAWGPEGQRAAMRSLLFDYLWIILYASAIGLACLYVAGICEDLGWEALEVLGSLLAKGAVLAGIFDAAENLVLMLELAREPTEVKVQVARSSAVIKFSLVGVCLFYVGATRGFAWLFGG